MTSIIETQRRGPALRHLDMTCMKNHYTVDLTAGCTCGCAYCYGPASCLRPRRPKVTFYANTAELLRSELARKKRTQYTVVFGTECEPFMPVNKILRVQYEIMRLLLEADAMLIISTKSCIPDSFIELFVAHTEKVQVQVAINTSNDAIRQIIEPKAASVLERLDNVKRLAQSGLAPIVRIDPIIPGLTDSKKAFTCIVKEVAARGAQRIIASYAFRRPDLKWPGQRYFADLTCENTTHTPIAESLSLFCTGGSSFMAPPEYRKDKYRLLGKIAARHGISVETCSWKETPEMQNRF